MQKLGSIIGSLPQLQTQSQSNACACGQPIEPIGKPPFVIVPRICTQCRAIEEGKMVKQAHRDKAAKLKERLTRVIPPLFIEAHLRDLSDKLRTMILNLPPTKGLFLYGPAGVGKSHAMATILRRFITAGRYCKRIKWDELCLELRSTFNGNGSELNILKPYRDCDVLVIEDIGTTTSINAQESDFNLRTLLLILDDRVENCKPTFITSNKSPEQLGSSFDSRIESRIYASCEIQAVSGNDKRRIKRFSE
jgi:DNA replication protein DnaC